MKFQTKYKLALWKSYFDNGYGLTSYPKWLLATVGIGSAIQGVSMWWVVLGGIIYGIMCFFLGWLWFKYKWVVAQTEVGNKYNLFVKEMRKKLKKKSI